MITAEWTNTGTKVVGEDERKRFLAVAESTTWISPEGSHPFAQGAALNAVTREFEITNGQMVGYDRGWKARGVAEGGYYTIVGIRTKQQRIYFVDRGSDILPTLIVTDPS